MEEVITLQAKPEPIRIDPSHTAVIVVDMQNDFAARGGMFDRAGIDISGVQTIIRPIARTLEAVRTATIPIVYLKMGFQPDLSDLGPADAPNRIKHLPMRVGEPTQTPDGTPGRFLIRDTWNTEIVRELAPKPGDAVVYKARYSGFYQTELDAVLRRVNARHLIVTGCTTSVCVESTVRDAMFRDYSCIVLEDCTTEVIGSHLARSNHEASLLVLQVLFGWVSTSNDLVEALAKRSAAASVRA